MALSATRPACPRSRVPDIKSFIESKNPRNETQLAATVAYYHQFMARGDDQKDAISAADVLDACRKADWKRPSRAAQTMINAYANGVSTNSAKASIISTRLVELIWLLWSCPVRMKVESRKPQATRAAAAEQ